MSTVMELDRPQGIWFPIRLTTHLGEAFELETPGKLTLHMLRCSHPPRYREPVSGGCVRCCTVLVWQRR